METYFPAFKDVGSGSEYYSNLKLKALFDADKILGNEIPVEQKNTVDDYFYSLLKPEVFWGPQGYVVSHNKSFESSCVVISQQLSRDPKEMTVLEYYQSIDDLRSQAKSMKRAKSNNR